MAVVVYASGKTTDKLLKIKSANLDKSKDNHYFKFYMPLKNITLNTIENLISHNSKEVIQEITHLFNQLKTLYRGCYLLEKLPPKAKATISSFGERLSSYIISEATKENLNVTLKDNRKLIITGIN